VTCRGSWVTCIQVTALKNRLSRMPSGRPAGGRPGDRRVPLDVASSLHRLRLRSSDSNRPPSGAHVLQRVLQNHTDGRRKILYTETVRYLVDNYGRRAIFIGQVRFASKCGGSRQGGVPSKFNRKKGSSRMPGKNLRRVLAPLPLICWFICPSCLQHVGVGFGFRCAWKARQFGRRLVQFRLCLRNDLVEVDIGLWTQGQEILALFDRVLELFS
jgi:hypothetical protein